jgi:hypothetical protein
MKQRKIDNDCAKLNEQGTALSTLHDDAEAEKLAEALFDCADGIQNTFNFLQKAKTDSASLIVALTDAQRKVVRGLPQ